MASVEYQKVVGEWRITDYDSVDDVDALPETNTLKGRVTFTAKWDDLDRFATIRVPEDGADPSFQLSVRPMVFPVTGGRLLDREARDGVMLPAVAGGVPLVWTAVPELYEDPGVGVKGPRVQADPVVFTPPEPDGAGERFVNLADVVNGTIEYPEPIVSQVAALVSDAETARTSAETAAGLADGSAQDAAGHAAAALASANAAALSEANASTSAGDASSSAAAADASAGAAAQSAADADQSALDSAGSASSAAGSATAAGDSATAAGVSETNAAGSATAAGGSETAAAGHSADALAQANRAESEADRAELAAENAELGAPAGGWSYAELAASVQASLDSADTAVQSIPNASDTVAGVVQLAGDLAGTWDNPTVPALAQKADLSGGKLVTSQIPAVALTKPTQVADRAGMLALTAEGGDVAIISTPGDPDRGSYVLAEGGDAAVFADWLPLTSADDVVQSVNGQTGTVNLDAGDVGAAAAAHSHTIGDVTGLQDAIDARPAFFSGEGDPPATIPGAVVGDVWLNLDTMELSKIEAV